MLTPETNGREMDWILNIDNVAAHSTAAWTSICKQRTSRSEQRTSAANAKRDDDVLADWVVSRSNDQTAKEVTPLELLTFEEVTIKTDECNLHAIDNALALVGVSACHSSL